MLGIWLPLTGKSTNQGLLGDVTTVTAPTFVANGKLGQTMSSGAFSITAEQANSFLNNDYFSICFWVYNNVSAGTSANRTVFGTAGMTAPNNRRYTVYIYPTYNQLHLSWQNYDSGDAKIGYVSGTDFMPSYEWTHVAVTYNGPQKELTIYKNGNVHEKRTNVFHFTSPDYNYATNLITNNANQYINDYRVYNHCLSAKEVKEISKGLVQHLKLDDGTIGTVTNILTAGGTYGTTTGSTWTGHYYVCTVEDATGGVPFARMNKMEITVSGTSTGGGASVARQTNIPVQPSTQYTYSTYLKPSDNFTYTHPNFLYRYEYDSAGTKTIEQGIFTSAKKEYIGDGWYRVWNTFTTQATTSKMHVYFYTYPGKTMMYYLGGCQLEKGGVLHPYTEGTQTNGTVPDCSGFLNNGTIYGSPTMFSASPRYERSTYIGTNNAIVAGRGGMVRYGLTVAIWGYSTTWSSYSARLASCTEGGGWNFEPSNGKMNFAMGTGASSNTYKSATSSRTLASLGSGWHHFVGTYDGFTTKIYIDGVLEGSNAAYTTFTPAYYANNAVFLGAEAAASQTAPTGSYFDGALSDFRIYGTALSAEDVAELYHTPASIDNKGNFYCYELKEV